jgi:hypothetical protein
VKGDRAAAGDNPAHVLEPHASQDARELRGARKAPHRAREIVVGVRVAGGASEQGHHAIKPQSEEPRQWGPVGRGDLEHDDASAGAHDAPHLANPARELGEVARTEADGRRVEGVVGVGQLERVGEVEADGRAGRVGLAPAELEHPLREVAGDDLSARPHPPGEREREVAGSRRHVERPVTGPEAREVRRALAPAMVEPGGHDRVHHVVHAGDAVEHRPHLRLGERAAAAHV